MERMDQSRWSPIGGLQSRFATATPRYFAGVPTGAVSTGGPAALIIAAIFVNQPPIRS